MIKKLILVCLISIILPGVVSGDFTINPEGTVVTDTSTNLMWEVKTDDGGPRDKDNYYSWEQALSYCENLTLAGYNDWRLPNRNELQSIVDYNTYNPSIDPIFSYTQSSGYWSSTTYASDPYDAWIVDFGRGPVGNSSVSRTAATCGRFGVDSVGHLLIRMAMVSIMMEITVEHPVTTFVAKKQKTVMITV